MNQDVVLETKDYYAKGISYQAQIDKMIRTNKLPEQLSIMQKGDEINFDFPKIFNSKKIEGKIFFYRPSDNNKDFTVNIEPDSSGMQIVPVSNVIKGLWKIKVDWLTGGTSYFNEKILMVN